MKKKTKLLLSTSLSITTLLAISPLAISCSKSKENDNNSDDQDQSTELSKLVANNSIEVGIKNSIKLSESIFNQYKNNDEQMNKLVQIKKNDSHYEKLSLSVLPTPTYDEKVNKLNLKLKLQDLENSSNYVIFNKSFDFNFVSDQEYVLYASNEINSSLALKPQYLGRRLIDLISQTNSNDEFINNYMDMDSSLENIIGVTYKLTIPTQTITYREVENSYYMKFTIKLYNDGQELSNPTGSYQPPYLYINANSQKDTFTIFNYEDLSSSQLNLSTNYLGKLFIRTNGKVNSVNINYNFSNKGIVGEVDFSQFSNIVFNSSFSNNNISSLKFNPSSTIDLNNNSDLFSGNKISTVDLPNTVLNYASGCFGNAQVYGLNSIQNLNNYYNKLTNILDLSNVGSPSEFSNVIKTIINVQEKRRATINFNKIYLPKESFLKNNLPSNLSLSCDELIFKDTEGESQDLSSINFSSWKIKKIIVPSSVIKINRNYFNNSVSIERTFNQTIRKLIDSNGNLIINKTKLKVSIDNKTFDLWTDINNLDYYFWGTNDVQKITINESVVDTSSSWLNWNFFKDINQSNKQIIFAQNVRRINRYFYDGIKNFISGTSINLTRSNYLGSPIVNNSTLFLDKFYSSIGTDVDSTFIYEYLIGYENIITTIDASNVSEIKKYTFNYLSNWNNVIISLGSNINKISQYAFNQTGIKINIEQDFDPQIIESYALSGATISGNKDLEFSNLSELGDNAFRNARGIDSISLLNRNISEIKSNTFYGLTSLKNINCPYVVSVGDYSFYNCTNLTSFNFTNITSIGTWAFYNCSNLVGDIILNSSISKIGSRAFQSCLKITSIQNLDLNEYNVLDVLGSRSTKIQINNLINNEELYNMIGYNQSANALDLSDFDETNQLKLNYLNLFLNQLNPSGLILEQLILPNRNQIPTFINNLFSQSITIKKLIWNFNQTNDKKISSTLSSLLGNAKVLEMNEDFFIGASEVPSNFFNSGYADLKNTTFNLNTITKVGNNAFNSLKNPISFNNTTNIKEIGSRAFNDNCTFAIGTDVKLQEDSFTTKGVINNPSYKITRTKVFSSNNPLNNYYNQLAKTLDFSQVRINTPTNNYLGISSYLVDGDVNKIILPNIYVLPTDLVNNLGSVESIEFQYINQVIGQDCFIGTTIRSKPTKDETHILLDLDNFFS